MKSIFYNTIDTLKKILTFEVILISFGIFCGGYLMYIASVPREDIKLGSCVQYRPMSQVYKITEIVNGYALLQVVKPDRAGKYVKGFEMQKSFSRIHSGKVKCP